MKVSSRYAACLIAILSLFAVCAFAQEDHDSPEQILFRSANHERVERRLPPLRWNAALAAAARQHALLMTRQNTLSHQFSGEQGLAERAKRAGASFSSIAENVAEGPTAEGIHQQWMKSPPHRANLLDPLLDSVGIAADERNGTIFAVEDFSLAGGDLSLQDQESAVKAQLQSRGLRLLDYTNDARRTCVLDNGYAGSHRPSFILHYATSNLQDLPDMLEQRIRSGKYHSGAVGACPWNDKSGFSGYRIAVMLYE